MNVWMGSLEIHVRIILMSVRMSPVRMVELARMELTPTLVNVWMGSLETHVRIILMTVGVSEWWNLQEYRQLLLL